MAEKGDAAPKVAADEHKPGKREWRFATYGVPLITLLLGIGGTLLVQSWSNRIAVFEYSATGTSGLFRRPEFPGSDIELRVDGRPVSNISTLTVRLRNTSSRDFESVPIEINFSSPNGTPKLLQARSTTPITSIPLPPSSQPATAPTGSLRIAYVVPIANRADQPILQADFVFEGSEIPSLTLTAHKTGVTTEAVEERGGKTTSFLFPDSLVVILTVAIVSAGASQLVEWFHKRRDRAKKANAEKRGN